MIDRSLNYGRHHIMRYLRLAQPFRNVLDIGAGSGADLAICRLVNPHARLHAVEVYADYAEALSRDAIEVCRLNIENEPLPCPDGTVDVVIANQVLEHTKEIFWIAHEVTRVLAPGGKFIIGVPNLAALHNRILLLMGRQPSSVKTNSAHVRGFTKYDLLKFFESGFPGGYALAAFGGSNFYPFPPRIAGVLASLFPKLAVGIFLMLGKRGDYARQFLDFPREQRLETNFYLGKP